MNTNELEFSIFCVESIAERLGMNGREAYELLAQKSDMLDTYIVPCYAVLHTQGKEYIVNDLITLLRKEGYLK